MVVNARRVSLVLVSVLLLVLIASCAKPTTYESPVVTPSSKVKPVLLPQNQKSPIPTPTRCHGPHFELDRPLRANSTVVTGKGPAGVPIVIVDVTRMGLELGSGVIGPDGRFSIQVSPLPAGHRVGIMLGDVSGTDINPDDFTASNEYIDLPLVGILFDAAMVEE